MISISKTLEFLCLLICSLTHAEILSDRIISLPGWNGALPSKHYGGYLNVSDPVTGKLGTHLYYLFAESEGNPSTDPIILWMNGGPGCSSLLGYFTENGAFKVSSGSTLSLNRYRWTRMVSNRIYLIIIV